MKQFASLILALGIVAAALPAPARADQQLWAAAYVEWSLASAEGGASVEQDIWLPEPAAASFFTLNWDFTTGTGGYIGLQSDETGATNARFSLWDTIVATGDACRRFDGEGEGMTCVIPLPLDRAGTYRVIVERGAADAQGQWWLGSLVEPSGARRPIGSIRVDRRHTAIAPATLHNFSEFWGEAVAACRNVPASGVVFGAPRLFGDRGGAITASSPNGTRPAENVCRQGHERLGAAVTHRALAWQGLPAMALALGGAPQDNQALAAWLATADQPAR